MEFESAPTRWKVAGVLSPLVATVLRIGRDTRQVRLHETTVRHIVERRGPEATFVLDYLAATIQQPTLVAHDPLEPRRLNLIRFDVEPERHLLVALKHETVVTDAASIEYLWVATALPLGNRSLTRLSKRIILKEVNGLADR
jgi:hypothetical protein